MKFITKIKSISISLLILLLSTFQLNAQTYGRNGMVASSNRVASEVGIEILKQGGWVRLKTDDTGLFEYTLHELKLRDDLMDLEYTRDLATSEMRQEHHGIITRYEQMFSEQGEMIKYLKFRFKEEILR